MNNKERCEAKWQRCSLCISSIFDAQENRETIDKHESSRPNRLAESANLTSNCQKLKIAGVRELFLIFYCRWRLSLTKPTSASSSSSVTCVSQAYTTASSASPTAGTTRATLAKRAAPSWTPSKLHPPHWHGLCVFIPHRESHATFLLQLLCGEFFLKKKEEEKNPPLANRRAMCFGFSPPLVTIYRISLRPPSPPPHTRPRCHLPPPLSHKQQPSARSPHVDGPI